MKCEVAQERIVAAEYGELAEEQAQELERHLAGCPECGKEREKLLALKELAGVKPVVEPGANLIARSRLRLEEALNALPPRRWYERLGQRMRNNLASLQAAPIAACLLLVVGACAGLLGSNELAANRARHPAAAQATTARTSRTQVHPDTTAGAAAPAEIANISSIVREPNSHMVEVRYNQLVPQRMEGSLDDPAIRQLLMLASENSTSAGVRDDSVGLMAAECKAGHGCQKAAGIRNALMVALRYDRNEGVREKALLGLEPYVSEDMQVRDAVLEALMNDGDPRIRTAAINILAPVEADTSVRQVLYSVSNSDSNPHIRNVSRQVLNSVPEIQ
ncbi:MAG: zf-HC2 domain-containing protein [Terracidiphilus sp.]|jgi:anti-sigma factor RsiW